MPNVFVLSDSSAPPQLNPHPILCLVCIITKHPSTYQYDLLPHQIAVSITQSTFTPALSSHTTATSSFHTIHPCPSFPSTLPLPYPQSSRRSENGLSVPAEESSNVDHAEGLDHTDKEPSSEGTQAPVLGWGTKPTFANVSAAVLYLRSHLG